MIRIRFFGPGEINSEYGRSDDRGAAAIVKTAPQLGCFSQDSEPSRLPKKVLGSIRRVRFTQPTLRQAIIREDKGTSLGKIPVKNPHQRSPNAVKFEDRSQKKKKRLKDNSDAPVTRHGILSNIFTSSKEKEKATFYSFSEEWVMPAASTIKSEEREFVVDSRASP